MSATSKSTARLGWALVRPCRVLVNLPQCRSSLCCRCAVVVDESLVAARHRASTFLVPLIIEFPFFSCAECRQIGMLSFTLGSQSSSSFSSLMPLRRSLHSLVAALRSSPQKKLRIDSAISKILRASWFIASLVFASTRTFFLSTNPALTAAIGMTAVLPATKWTLKPFGSLILVTFSFLPGPLGKTRPKPGYFDRICQKFRSSLEYR